MGIITTAYALSYGLQFWFTLFAVVVAVGGQVPWEETTRIEFYLWVMPLLVLAYAVFQFVRTIAITGKANIHAAEMQRKAYNAWEQKRQSPASPPLGE